MLVQNKPGGYKVKNIIRDGGSTALYTAYTVDTVNNVGMVYTVDMVYTVGMVYTVDMVYKVDMVYTVGTVYTVYTIQTDLHCFRLFKNNSIYAW